MQSQRIAHFDVLERLGAGAMGVVYRARDTMLGREVALKVIRADLAADRHSRGRFLRECRAAASINHPGIATVYEAGEADGDLFLASEMVAGETLQTRLARGRLTPVEVADLGIQLAEALEAAHGKGVVHRDIKPANLMIQASGRVKVLDFGLARLQSPDDSADETATRTRAGTVVGTPAYMSPEQATGSTVDARTDIFSAGSVLYAAASGREPFLARSVPDTLRRILSEDPAPLESLDPAMPLGLSRVIRKALAKRPEDRFTSAAELSGALKAVREEMVPSWPSTPAHPALRPSRRRRIAGAVALVLALAAVVSILAIRGLRSPGLEFGRRDKLLIASVDNQTDEPAFDLALRTALEADLQQSRHVVVFDSGQVAETLRLMRRDPGTRIDEALGRDICRFAGVRALLLPRILSAGDAYELQAILIDPQTGHHVDRVRVAARGREEVLLHAIDELARTVRRRLGESIESIERADEPVIVVTTSSWEALNYLTLGQIKWGEQKIEEARTLFEKALEKDPRFAAAKGSLGLLLIQFLNEPERGKQLLRETLDDSADLPERERLMAQAINLQFVAGDLDGALEEYGLIAELYPDLMQPHNNAGRILMQLGRYDEAAREFETAASLDVHNSVPLLNLWWLNQQLRRDPHAGEAAGRRLVELGPDIGRFQNMLGWSLLSQRRFDEAVPVMRRAFELDPRDSYVLPNTAHLLYRTGAYDDAIGIYRQWLGLIDQGDMTGARPIVARDLALALRAAGRSTEAVEVATDQLDRLDERQGQVQPADLLTRGQLEVLRGNTDRARACLARALQQGIGSAEDRVGVAALQTLLGQTDDALDSIRRALADGYREPFVLLVHPPLQPLFDDPRFVELIVAGAPASS